jgi:hypothetical protein
MRSVSLLSVTGSIFYIRFQTPVALCIMPKVVTHAVVSSSEQAGLTASARAVLRSYYCLCGDFVLVLQGKLDRLPRRRSVFDPFSDRILLPFSFPFVQDHSGVKTSWRGEQAGFDGKFGLGRPAHLTRRYL